MRWFDRTHTAAPQLAKFADVSHEKRRMPSWVPNRPDAARGDTSSLRPPRLPSEFVDAVRHELDHEFTARARLSLSADALGRRSEFPASGLPTGSLLPSSPLNAPLSVAAGGAAPPEPQMPQVDPLLGQAFEQAIVLLATERQRVLTETAAQLAELAVLIARRVIGRELSLDPALVQGLVREGLQALGQHDRALVRVGTGFVMAREAIEQDLSDHGGRFEVRVDPALEVYGCRIETELGQVDESIESRLETLLGALRPESDLP
jgi:hypothetical protein